MQTNNTLIIGHSGWKVFSNIFNYINNTNNQNSYIITDINNALYDKTYQKLQNEGYKIDILDFENIEKSTISFNIMTYLNNDNLLQYVANSLMTSIPTDEFEIDCEKYFLLPILKIIKEKADKYNISKDITAIQTILQNNILDIAAENNNLFSHYNDLSEKEKLKARILISHRTDMFNIPELDNIFSEASSLPSLNINNLINSKYALFINISHKTCLYNYLINIILKLISNELNNKIISKPIEIFFDNAYLFLNKEVFIDYINLNSPLIQNYFFYQCVLQFDKLIFTDKFIDNNIFDLFNNLVIYPSTSPSLENQIILNLLENETYTYLYDKYYIKTPLDLKKSSYIYCKTSNKCIINPIPNIISNITILHNKTLKYKY